MSDKNGEDIGDAWGTAGGHHVHVKAKMPVDRYATNYNMQHKKRGIALILNHEFFKNSQLKQRVGTNVDCENLSHALKSLHFDVIIEKDLLLRDLQYAFEKLSKLDYTDSDCILITILTHGEAGYLYAQDCQYKLDMLMNYFTAINCPTLAGKPKLFFIQACQGDRLDSGLTLYRTETDSGDALVMSYKIPVYADFLFAYSTIPGFYSWRNTTRGSWFIQSLCVELAQHGKEYDILKLLTFVCQRVAIDHESNSPDNPHMHQQKQIPCITSMLTRLVTFTDK